MAARSSGAATGVRLPLLLVAPLVIFLVVFLVAKGASSMLSGSSQEVNPFAERDPMVPSVSAASRAAASASGADGEILTRLAGVPTAIWLTPEAYPIDQVGDVVAESAKQADTTDRTAVFVVYGITDRDCVGGESSGGLSPDQYEEWVERIADAAGSRSAVILEPDALATASECDQVDQRTTLLREAVQELTDGGPAVYVDAGHAHWVDPTEMATMLTSAGVEDARGFSTNVAGYESVEDERDYAEQVKAALGDASYVIDTSRNGAGSNGEWCNPSGRALGPEPQVGTAGSLDAYLWIKPPGESDGECGGGPPAGEFWTERALELAANAGW